MTPAPKKPTSDLGMDGALADALVRSRRFFTRGTVSADLRTLTKTGGRDADDFYRTGGVTTSWCVRPMA